LTRHTAERIFIYDKTNLPCHVPYPGLERGKA
jgi:hypothetical protein